MARRRGIDPADVYPGIFRDYGRGGDYYYPDNGYYYPYTTYYPQAPAVDVNAVTVRLHVPTDAQVWFEGEATAQTGEDRDFVSPALTPGREYTYHIRVRWQENDKPVERKRDVKVHAGDRINLNIDR